MPFNLGPVELGLILLIVAMLFGVGKLPEVFGSIGKGVREFRKESGIEEGKNANPQVLPPAPAPVAQLPAASAAPAPYVQASAVQTPVVENNAANTAANTAVNNNVNNAVTTE
jgi:sec-independent protein translocase protein TatA